MPPGESGIQMFNDAATLQASNLYDFLENSFTTADLTYQQGGALVPMGQSASSTVSRN